MVWTPKGTIWLGMDKMLYILPFGQSTPTPIGHKIHSYTYLAGIEGVEDTPNAQMEFAAAVYHDGFYKLSVAGTGKSVNNVQWWLDVSRLQIDEDGFYGPWYGPMEGNVSGVTLGTNISCFASLTGPGDGGELLGGEDTASNNGFVYDLHKRSLFDDVGTTMPVSFQTYFHPMEADDFEKVIHHLELTLSDVVGTVNVEFHDISGAIKTGDSLGLSGTAVYWDDLFWDEFDWSNDAPTRVILHVDPSVKTRRLSLIIHHSTSTDKFELYNIRVKATEETFTFDT